MNRFVVWKIRWKHIPLATGFQYVQQGAEYIVEIVFPRFCSFFCRFKKWANRFKLFPRYVAGVHLSLHSFVLVKPLERRIHLFGDLR